MASDVLRVTQLSKRYRGRRGVQANDGIDLDIAPGQVVGLLGHNGAGKTTLVNQIVGLVRPDSGRIEVGGVDAVARPDAARRLVSVQAQANVPISGLSPRRAVELVGRIRGADAEATRRRTSALLDALDRGPAMHMADRLVVAQPVGRHDQASGAASSRLTARVPSRAARRGTRKSLKARPCTWSRGRPSQCSSVWFMRSTRPSRSSEW